MVKVVVLDVDGTLMDTNYLHTEAWARAFERVGPSGAEGQAPQADRQGRGAFDPGVRRRRGDGRRRSRTSTPRSTRSYKNTATRFPVRRS